MWGKEGFLKLLVVQVVEMEVIQEEVEMEVLQMLLAVVE
jgi:hypothetical protein